MAEFYSIVGGFTFTVGSDDEENARVFGDLVEILKVVFFWVTDERRKTEFRFGFLCETDCVLFCRACLRTVEDDNTFFLKNARHVNAGYDE